MSNQRNVDALAAAFGGAFFKVTDGALDPGELRRIAEEVIAARGVVVPATLTQMQALEVVQRGGLFDVGTGGERFTGRVIGALEDAARGKLG